eukprot:9501795-Pyramimonas_sp.AAC.1
MSRLAVKTFPRLLRFTLAEHSEYHFIARFFGAGDFALLVKAVPVMDCPGVDGDAAFKLDIAEGGRATPQHFTTRIPQHVPGLRPARARRRHAQGRRVGARAAGELRLLGRQTEARDAGRVRGGLVQEGTPTHEGHRGQGPRWRRR